MVGSNFSLATKMKVKDSPSPVLKEEEKERGRERKKDKEEGKANCFDHPNYGSRPSEFIMNIFM